MAIGTLVVPTVKLLMIPFASGDNQPMKMPSAIAPKIHQVRCRSRNDSL
ncbi:MAG: hypothetical protein H6R01_2064 [Burkholderiaceae bacterium]|nr:hypothetical protein [Burkholderiaceae bacterium]